MRISPSTAGVPALPADKVAVTAPVDAVLAAGSVGVGDLSVVVGPERVVVAVIRASLAGGYHHARGE